MPNDTRFDSRLPASQQLIAISAEGLASLGVREPSLDLLRPIAEAIAALEPSTDAMPQTGAPEDAR